MRRGHTYQRGGKPGGLDQLRGLRDRQADLAAFRRQRPRTCAVGVCIKRGHGPRQSDIGRPGNAQAPWKARSSAPAPAQHRIATIPKEAAGTIRTLISDVEAGGLSSWPTAAAAAHTIRLTLVGMRVAFGKTAGRER
jgi:hypothetical protein